MDELAEYRAHMMQVADSLLMVALVVGLLIVLALGVLVVRAIW